MRWATFQINGQTGYGLVTENGVIDAARRVGDRLPSLKAAIAADELQSLAGALANEPVDAGHADVQWLPVIPDASKIFCIGLNYKAHVEETGRSSGDKPTVFVRFNESQVGHDQPMLKPAESDAFDFEGEIALIIGKAGRRISRSDAMAHVAGYAPFNDGSVRDYQRHTTQFTPGKNFFASGGFGPWMMTPDEVGNIDDMEITTRLNGEVMQNSKASLLIFDFVDLIEYLSSFTELRPGDVIVTGTPGGVGVARKPPVFMQSGDLIEVEVKPVGTLANRIAAD